jgi:hypothetical protein
MEDTHKDLDPERVALHGLSEILAHDNPKFEFVALKP